MAPTTEVRIRVARDAQRPALVRCPAGCSGVVETLDLAVEHAGEKRTLSAETAVVRYSAVEEPAALSRWAVGVFDPATGSLDVRECDAVFSLHPRSKRQAARRPDQEGMTYLEKQIEIANAFGSRKKQKQLQQRQAGLVNPNNAFGAEGLTDIIKELSATKADAKFAGSTKLLPFPREDVDPADAYDYDLIFGLADSDLREALDGQLGALRRFATERGRSTWIPEEWGAFVTARLVAGESSSLSLSSSSKKEEDDDEEGSSSRGVHAALLLRHMMTFSRLDMKGSVNVVSYGREKQIPERVVRRLVEEYTESLSKKAGSAGGVLRFARTTELQEKLVAHITLLALLVSGFAVDTKAIAEAIGVPAKRVASHAKLIGCIFPKVKGATTATLEKLPQGTCATLRVTTERKRRN